LTTKEAETWLFLPQLLSPEERERRCKFEQKRKMHYNEFYAVKMARQLMEQVILEPIQRLLN
jgi:hypothetical protein